MFFKSLIFGVVLVAIAAGVLLALILPSWLLAVVLAVCIVLFGAGLICRW